MKSICRSIRTILGIGLLIVPIDQALAQSAEVDLGNQQQYIHGFGGMVHIPWAGDLDAAERMLAFGNADGQLGLTILRIAVPDGNTSDSSYVATAKAAIAAGGIVYASPWNSGGNMVSSQFSSYADHLKSFVTYMQSQGVDLYAISVQNEPDYGSQGGWRSWTAAQCHDFVLNYGAQVGTKLMSCESFNYSKSLYDPILDDAAALAKLGVLGTHLYGTSLNSFSYPLFDQKAAGKERWMTEHYTDSDTDANSWPNALNVATELHNSMVVAQFNAYTWWYIKRSYGLINNGAITKRGACMAHWSKFVRPGFYRVDATASPASGVSLSAYKSSSDVVIIAVNTAGATSLNVSITGSDISTFEKFTTSADKNLANDGTVTASGGSLTVPLDGSSVTTLHGMASGGSTGTGGSSGSSHADAGRDDAGLDGTGGASAMHSDAGIGTGGTAANSPNDGNSGSGSGTGGALASGGTQTGAGGVPPAGSGGQVSTGGVSIGAGGSQAENSAQNRDSAGCSCYLGQRSERPAALAAFLVLAPVLACRRRVRAGTMNAPSPRHGARVTSGTRRFSRRRISRRPRS